MSQLVAYYDEEPLPVDGRVEVYQAPLSTAAGTQSSEGFLRSALVYVYVRIQRPSGAGPLLVPFGDFDEWFLRDRYREAIRIMNTLGAATITCETFRETSARRGVRGRILGNGGDFTRQRDDKSGFDYRHEGAGNVPRDPRPLQWPDEPGFDAAVSSVLDNGATEVDINIRSRRTHKVEGTLGVQLTNVGFDLGGGTQQSGETALHIHATFPQRGRWR